MLGAWSAIGDRAWTVAGEVMRGLQLPKGIQRLILKTDNTARYSFSKCKSVLALVLFHPIDLSFHRSSPSMHLPGFP